MSLMSRSSATRWVVECQRRFRVEPWLYYIDSLETTTQWDLLTETLRFRVMNDEMGAFQRLLRCPSVESLHEWNASQRLILKLAYESIDI
jgi:hypothetical protein